MRVYQIVSTFCLLAATLAQASEFIPLGDLSGGDFWSSAIAVSDDGSTVIGQSKTGRTTSGHEGFVWTPATGMAVIGAGINADPGSTGGGPRAVSSDGAFIVGGDNHSSAFVWDANRNATPLPSPILQALGIDHDGSFVVGQTMGPSGSPYTGEAYRLHGDGNVQLLGHLPNGYESSSAWGVSADGSVVVGMDMDNSVFGEAFLWSQQTGMTGLGHLSGTTFSWAKAVSADGTVVVGRSDFEAFRYTRSDGMTRINLGQGDVPSFANSNAYGVSGDGAVIVGRVVGVGAFIWHATRDMNFLQEVLADEYGLGNSLNGWRLDYAYDISANGRYIVGRGRNPLGQNEAWLARLDYAYGVPEPGNFMLLCACLTILPWLRRRCHVDPPPAGDL